MFYIDMGELVAAHLDTLLEPPCMAPSPRVDQEERYLCTAVPGHAGPHIAFAEIDGVPVVVGIWGDDLSRFLLPVAP